MYNITDFNIKISLINPIKGGNPIFKINKKNKSITKIKEKDIILTTNNERVFIHTNIPTTQNIKGEINP